jgi:hypothetical protein
MSWRRIEAAPEQSRVAEDNQQRVPNAPRKPKAREVHLRLAARRRLEAHDRLGRRRRPHALNERFQLGVAAVVAGRADFLEETHRRELRIRGEARFNDRFVAIELRGHRRSGPVPDRRRVEIAIQIAVANPSMNRVAADAQLARQCALAGALLQVVPE